MTCSLGPSSTPATLATLAQYLVSKGYSNLGIVGSRTHRGGYHLGRGRIYAFGDPYFAGVNPDGTCAKGKGDTDYSVADFARDRAAITNAATAIDIGPGTKGAGAEVAMGKWLIAQCQAGAPDCADIRGVNYQTMRWDRKRGQTSAVYDHGLDESGHIHVEFFRDAVGSDRTAPFRRYLGAPGGTLEMFPVVTRTVLAAPNPRTFTIPAGATIAGYDPAQPGKVVKSAAFPSSSSAHATHGVQVDWMNLSGLPAPVPRGGPFLLVSDGTFAGLLIVASAVQLAPAMTIVDPTVTFNAGVDAAAQAAAAAKK